MNPLTKVGAVAVIVVALGVMLYESGRRSVKAADKAVAAQARVDTVMVERAAQVDTVRLTIAKVKPIHDSTTIIDSVRVEIPGATVRAPPDTVVIPSIIVRRLIGDSLIILSQAKLIVSDSNAIHALQLQVKTVDRRRWYDDRLTIGPSVNAIVGRDGKVTAGLGVSVQIRVWGWP